MSYVYPVAQATTCNQSLSIRAVLETQAERTPNAIAIAAPGRPPLTYGRLRTYISQVVQTLNAMGLGRHDRVALVLPNGPEMAVAFLAIAAGATSAPLNPAYQVNEFDFYLSDLHAKALIIQAGIDSPARAVAQKRGIAILELSPVFEAEAGIFTLRGNEHSHPAGVNGCTLLPGFAQPDDVALVLHTSGTTSRPKIVPLTHTNLCTSAYNIQVALALTAEDRCLNVMPLFHIHGLIGATLASLTAGASVVCTPGFDVSTFFEWMEALQPTWYTAVPTMHQAILTRAESNHDLIARCPLRFLRSCSAALPPQVMTELERVFQAPVIESYGMTEASHQMASNPLPPRARKAGAVGVAAGPEIAIMDEMGHLLPPGHKGEIVIRGANVTQGYENNPAANESAFTKGWFRTGDQGCMDVDGYLFITGRLKEIINRGGEKISPREVDDVLMEHPAIAQVVTFAAPHALLGEEVAAAVVLREHTAATEREIQEFAATRLADFKVPRRVLILKDVPKGPTGKLQRIGLAEKLGLTAFNPAHPKRERTFVAPRDTLERQLTKIWEKVLAIKPIGIKDNFFDLGGYSLLAVHLFEEIEKVTGKTLPLATLFQAATVEQLADLLRREEWSALWSPLVAIQSNGSKPPFFFVHAIGGNVLNYRSLSRYLGPDQPFYGLQSQGLDGKQAPHTRVEDMAALYIQELRILQSEGPYFLGGGSSGGIVAFEMAQQLHAQGQKVALLVLFDAYFLSDLRYQPHPALFRSKIYRWIQKVDLHLGNLLLRTPKDQLSYILGMVGRIKTGVGRKLQEIIYKGYSHSEASLSRALQMVLKANRQALCSYVPQVYSGRITLFLCSEAPERSFYDSRLGWNDMAGEGLEVHVIPGNHETLFSEPHVRGLAEKLQVCLQKVRATNCSVPHRQDQN
jgi:acyl-CoA synthetase (AMP-forming)/AMP-acid ligase II/thioesterase domain-containing protein